MTDAPKWPGADGSPGLDFSGKPKKPEAAPDDGDKTQLVRSAPDRRSQSAKDWQLEGITRNANQTTPHIAPRPVIKGGQGPLTKPASAPAAAVGAGAVAKPGQPAKPTGQPAKQSAPTMRKQQAPTKPITTNPAAAKPASAMAASAAPASAPAANKLATAARGVRRTRKARLRVQRIDPWSVMKTSLLFAVAFGVMTVVGVGVLWAVFSSSDTMTHINDLVNSVISDPESGKTFDIKTYLSWERVVGLTAVIAAIDAVIFTAVATLFAFLYNLSAVVMGGLEIMFAED